MVAIIAPAIPWIVGGIVSMIFGHEVLPGKEQREQDLRKLGGAVWGNETMHMEQAESDAEENSISGDLTDACSTCEENRNPCKHLERGAGSGPYRGGSFRGTSIPVGDGLDAHHMPANAASTLSKLEGPAIQMTPIDHWRTASNGRMPGHAAYIFTQQSMINSGNFIAATQLDIVDIRTKFGSKYDEAIEEMQAYTACLKSNGRIN